MENIWYIYTVMKCYRHYKGGLYKCIAIAKDSETLLPVVVYQALYGDRLIWVRDYQMFFGNVVVDGVEKKRFEEIEISEGELTNLWED